MREITGLTLKELETAVIGLGERAFCARQIFSWVYQKRVKDFAAMTNLSLPLREKLKANFPFLILKPVQVLTSSDATAKLLFSLEDKNLIEAVIIPVKDRFTGCISSQVGCKFKCSFCASGMLGFKRDLTSAEIVAEVLALEEHSAKKLTHLVFMGTGEPLDNYAHVLKAIRILNCAEGINIGARRITISTSGIIPGIKQLAKEGLQVELSISLHAADEKTRSVIMPVNKKYPLSELMLACRDYIAKTNRQITFEYVLIKGLNSDLQNAQNLSKILKGLLCKVNLIPANPIKELYIEPPSRQEILSFRDKLLKSGVSVTIRKERGADIQAACGQLRLNYGK